MPYSEINALRKEGRLAEAIAKAEDEYRRMPGKLEAIALFWCLNDQIKRIEDEDEGMRCLNRMRELFIIHDPDNDMLQRALSAAERLFTPEGRKEKEGWKLLRELQAAPLDDIDARKRMLLKYLQMDLRKPSLLHSRILDEALKMEKSDPGQFAFAKFADMWGLDSFMDDDWEQRQNKNGHILPSLTERAITAYMKEMQGDANIAPSQPFRQLLAEASARYPRNLHLPRYAAQILVRDGKKDEAIEAFKSLLIRTPDKFYLWDDLSHLIDDQDIKIGLLCGAVTTGALDEFLPNIRLRLADLFCNLQMYGNARVELERYERAHQAKHWPIPRRFYSVYNRIPHGTASADNHPVYLRYKAMAERFLFANIPAELMVKTWEKKEAVNGKQVISWQMRRGDETFWIKPKRFHLDFSSRNGSVFNVKLINNQVVWAEAAELEENLPWLKQATGQVSIHSQPGTNKTYGFVDDVFVPGYLLFNRASGDIVTATAILNGERWQALQIR